MTKMFIISKRFLILTLILVYGVAFGQTEIRGKVISEISGETPISDIYIHELVTSHSLIITDSTGIFHIKQLELNKTYIFEISVFGYGKQKFNVQTKNGTNEFTFELKANCEYNAERAESDWENGKANLLLIGSIAPIANTSSDNHFEEKYGIQYFDFGCMPPIAECIQDYNVRIFELMDEKYGRIWREEVRSDVEYLN